MFSFSTNFYLKEFVKTFIRPNLISYFNTGLSAAHFRSLTAEGSHAWKYQRRSLGKPQSALCRLIARWHTLTLRAFWEGRQNRFVVVHIHNTGCNFCVSCPTCEEWCPIISQWLQLDNWVLDCEAFILRRKLCVVLRNGSYEAPFFSKNITEAHPNTWSNWQ